MSNLIEIRIVARDETRGALEATEQQTRALGEQAEQTSSQLSSAGESAQQMGSDVAASGEAMDTAGSSASELSDGAEQAGSALSDAGEDAAGLAGEVGEAGDALTEAGAAGSDAASGVAEADDAMGSVSDSAAAAAGELGDAAAALGDAGSEAGSAASGFAEAGDSASGLDGSLGDTGDAMADTGAEAGVMSEAVREAGASMVGSEAAAGGLFSRLTKLSVALPLAGAGALALTNSTAAMGDKIAKSARTADVSTDFYQDMGFALGQAGVGVDQFDRLLERNVQRMGRAAEGNEKYTEAYEALGVAITDSNGELRASEEVFVAVLHALAGIEDSATRAALAGELLGVRAGRKLAGALESGIDGIEEARQKAHELGIVLGEDALTASEAFNDRMEDMTKAAGSAGREVGTALMPPLTALAELLAGVLSNDLSRNAVLVGGLALAVQHKLAPALKDATKNAGGLRGSLRGLGRALGPGIGIAGVTALATAAMDAYNRKKEVAAALSTVWTDALKEEGDAQRVAIRDTVANSEELAGLRDIASDLGLDMADVTDVIMNQRGAVGRWRGDVKETTDAIVLMQKTLDADLIPVLRKAAKEGDPVAQILLEAALQSDEYGNKVMALADELDVQAKGFERNAESVEASKQAEEDLTGQTEQLAATEEELTGQIQGLNDELDSHINLLQSVVRELFAAEDAEFAYKEALDVLTEATRENSGGIRDATEAANQQRDAVRGSISATIDKIHIDVEEAETAEQAKDAINRHRKALVEDMVQAGLTRKEAKRLVKEGLEPLDDDWVAEIILEKAQAERDLDELTRPRTVAIAVEMTESARKRTGSFGGRQHGGITGAQAGGVRDGPVWVGEGGPELVDLPPGSRVHPAGESARMAGGDVVNLTINVNVQGSILAERDLVEVVRDEFDRGGFGGVGAVA